MYKCIYIHISIHVYTLLCIYTYTYIYAYVYIRIFIYIYIGVYIYTFTYMYMSMCGRLQKAEKAFLINPMRLASKTPPHHGHPMNSSSLRRFRNVCVYVHLCVSCVGLFFCVYMCVCVTYRDSHYSSQYYTCGCSSSGSSLNPYPTLAHRLLPGTLFVFFCYFLLGRWRWNFERCATTTIKNTHTYSKNLGRIHLRIKCYPAHTCARAHTNKHRERIPYAFVTIHS